MRPVQRVLWLMVAASASVWAGALLDFGGAHDRARRGSSPTSAPASAPDRSATVSAAPNAMPGTAPSRPGEGSVHVIGEQPGGPTIGTTASAPASAAPSAAAPAPGAVDNAPRAELGADVQSPAYAAIEHDYALEVRDEAWAPAEEYRLRATLANSAVGPQVVLVSCQDTVCRIMLQAASADAFQQQLQVPGFSAATGLSSSTPYSLRDGQLSLYLRKR
jgi:hypothetical protein